MTLPRRAIGRSGYGGRGYRPLGRPEEPILPSVTTVLKSEAKPALQQWVADQTAAFAVANWEQLSRWSDSKGYGFLRYFWKREPKDPLSQATVLDYHTTVLSDAGELGDSVHEWIEADLDPNSPFPDVSDRSERFWECVAAWNEFKSQHDIKFHRVENTVWAPLATGLGYAGTFDLLLEIDGVLTLIDIKTSRGLYSSTWMQLAALYYAPYLLEEGEDGKDRFIKDWAAPIQARAVIHVRPSDTDREGNYMAPFCKLVQMPGKPELHYQSFMGLRQYMENQKLLNDMEKEAKKLGK